MRTTARYQVPGTPTRRRDSYIPATLHTFTRIIFQAMYILKTLVIPIIFAAQISDVAASLERMTRFDYQQQFQWACLEWDLETQLRVLPVTLSGPNGTFKTHALLDKGSSLTLVDEQVAVELGLVGEVHLLCFHWTNHVTREERHSRRVSLRITGDNEKAKMFAISRTINILQLPVHTIDMKQLRKECKHLDNIPFISQKRVRTVILLGQDTIILSTERKHVRGSWSSAVATLTTIGWVVHVRVPTK
ncbi:unnamed protein product [Allacma fusca]|uniref:Peptidase A2 domain-containing protein n=1 Tax=Allacma fusca TaxID=39272 RepID=A0A8J2J3M6_9HEXA|nr:unnamed protein product [Allacma fusca]